MNDSNAVGCGEVALVAVDGHIVRMMSAWAQRMHRGAATLSNVVTSCGHSTGVLYSTRMEKVKFGVTLDQVCKHDIPGPLLILILKLNKEAPYKKDVFRAPGHQGNMKKLIHFLQHGRLVNIDNFSVYTIASVLKKFLRKLPGGIFGSENEEELFRIIEFENIDEKRDCIHQLIASLPVVAQHLLVLLFGTFRAVASSSQRAQTGMSSEALGVSVAPSFFQSCVSDGKVARMEDVVRFKVATRIMKFMIDNFGVSNLFGRENYEYYARITGRILKVEEDWIFAFHYPPDTIVSRKTSLEAENIWLQQEAERWGLIFNLEAISSQEECQSTPALIHAGEPIIHVERAPSCSSLSNLGDAYTRLSVSLEDNGLFKVSSPTFGFKPDELKAVNRYAESTKSLSFLPLVHERQTARMRTRSEWFLNPSPCPSPTRVSVPLEIDENEEIASKLIRTESCKCASNTSSKSSSSTLVASGSEKQLVRRTSSKEKRLVRRSSSKSKRDKENGSGCGKLIGCSSASSGCLAVASDNPFDLKIPLATASTATTLCHSKKILSKDDDPVASRSPNNSHTIVDRDCTEIDVKTFHVTLTYKPRI